MLKKDETYTKRIISESGFNGYFVSLDAFCLASYCALK